MASFYRKCGNKDWELKQEIGHSINVLTIYYILDTIWGTLKCIISWENAHGNVRMVGQISYDRVDEEWL